MCLANVKKNKLAQGWKTLKTAAGRLVLFMFACWENTSALEKNLDGTSVPNLFFMSFCEFYERYWYVQGCPHSAHWLFCTDSGKFCGLYKSLISMAVAFLMRWRWSLCKRVILVQPNSKKNSSGHKTITILLICNCKNKAHLQHSFPCVHKSQPSPIVTVTTLSTSYNINKNYINLKHFITNNFLSNVLYTYWHVLVVYQKVFKHWGWRWLCAIY